MAGEVISIIHNAEMWPETERKKGSKYCSWLLWATLQNYLSGTVCMLQYEHRNDDRGRKNLPQVNVSFTPDSEINIKCINMSKNTLYILWTDSAQRDSQVKDFSWEQFWFLCLRSRSFIELKNKTLKLLSNPLGQGYPPKAPLCKKRQTATAGPWAECSSVLTQCGPWVDIQISI